MEEGFQLLEEGKTREAEGVFRAVLEAEPANLGAREGLIWALLDLGNPEEAARQADERMRLAPGDEDWEERYCFVLGRAPSRRTEAIEGYRSLLEASPEDVEARVQLAQLLSWSEGRLDESIAEYRKALEIDPDHRQARLGLALTLSWRGLNAESSRRFEAYLRDYPDDPEALLAGARLARWTGDRARALRLLDRAAALAPDHPGVLAETARLDLDLGRRAEARRAAKRAEMLAPELPEVRESLAAVEEATAPRFVPWSAVSDEDTPFRRYVLALPFVFHPLPDTRLYLEPLFTRFEDEAERLDRHSIGFTLLQGLPGGLEAKVLYRAHFPEGVAATHEFDLGLAGRPVGAPVTFQLGLRRRALVDQPGDYDQIAPLYTMWSGGVDIEGIRDRLQRYEGYGDFAATPWAGTYVYFHGDLGEVDGGNKRRSLAAGFGVNMLRKAGSPTDHDLTIKYDFYFLSFREEDPRYFSPRAFKTHTPGLEWRIRSARGLDGGILAGLPLRPGSPAGYIAGAFLRWRIRDPLLLEARARTWDNTEFRVTAFSLGLEVRF